MSFRPLIRGLSISSNFAEVRHYCGGFPSPHPGIINFFSGGRIHKTESYKVSVPSSGDYQFLLTVTIISFLPRLISSQYANREPHLNFPKNSICRQQLIV